MKRIIILLFAIVLMSCRSTKTSTETTIQAQTTSSLDIAQSTQAEKYMMQHILEDMFVKYNGYKEIKIFDTTQAKDTGCGFYAPVKAQVVVYDTVNIVDRIMVHDTAVVVIHDTLQIYKESDIKVEMSADHREEKTSQTDKIMSFFISVILLVAVCVAWQIASKK